jgi:hypothetical protein
MTQSTTGPKKRVNAEIDKTIYDDIQNLNYKITTAIIDGLKLFIESKKESNDGKKTIYANLEDKINKIQNQVEKVELRCNKLETILHSKDNSLDGEQIKENLELNELIYNYNISCSKIITDFKKQQLNLFTNRIKDLNNIKRINNITPEESSSLSISLLKKLISGDRVIAVSSFGKGEWVDNTYWKNYINAQREAVDAGAIVERIFNITKKSSDSSVKTIPVEMMHDSKTNKFIGYLMSDEDEAKAWDNVPSELKTPDLIDIFKNGFMLINSKSLGEMMAVIDHFDENFNYRTDIIFDINILTNIETIFNIMKENVRQISIN